MKITTTPKSQLVVKRGRPANPSTRVQKEFVPSTIELFRGSDLKFSDELFRPIKTNRVGSPLGI